MRVSLSALVRLRVLQHRVELLETIMVKRGYQTMVAEDEADANKSTMVAKDDANSGKRQRVDVDQESKWKTYTKALAAAVLSGDKAEARRVALVVNMCR